MQRRELGVSGMPEKQIKNLFIDANIWLSLFYFTSDDLEQFRKLKELIGKDIKLFVPEQIYNEVYRNRENKIKEALDKFEKFDLSFPVFVKNYDEYDEFYRKYGELKSLHKAWLKKVKEDIAEQRSPADFVLKDFFESIELLPVTAELVQRGVLRYNVGNPPGKDKKYGDAINWETLLENVPNGEDLFFVSADKDYASIYDEKSFNPFLEKEWETKKKSKIIFFKSLVEFLKTHFIDIELRIESEKDSLIEELVRSGSFATTHRIVAELSKHTDWSTRQVQDLCSAVIDNHQVGWILGDSDVLQFYKSLFMIKAIMNSTDEIISEVCKRITEVDAEGTDDVEEYDPNWWL